MKSTSIFLLLLALAWMPLRAQMLDRIVAIIGEEVILQSDVDNQYNYRIIQGDKDNGLLRCQVLENLIVSKLLYDKAVQDSLVVSEQQVMGEVDTRIDYILQQMGNDRVAAEAQFVSIYGKSVSQFRVDITDDIRKELLTDQQRQSLISQIDVTPKEVKKFFNSIPIDSMGILPAEVQLYHIVIRPPWSKESIEKVKGELSAYRDQIVSNASTIEMLAQKHSDEPAARKSKGSLGDFGRGMMVPEFEEVVYQMRVGEVSRPFQTEFGIHVAKLNDRRGEIVNVTHILKIPKDDAQGDKIARDSLTNIRKLILLDTLSFEEAAIRFSEDRTTRDCGGCIANPQTRELRIPLDALDADLYFKVEAMKEGEISEPLEMIEPDGSRAFHIIYLKNKIPPHKPNLKDDYQKIQNAALQNKQAEVFDKWLDQAQSNIFIDIKPSECANALKNWIK